MKFTKLMTSVAVAAGLFAGPVAADDMRIALVLADLLSENWTYLSWNFPIMIA